MDKFPVIETARLVLGELQSADIPRIVVCAGNARVAESTLNLPHPYTEKDAVSWINLANQGFKNSTQYIFAIRLKPENEFIGGIGVSVDVRHQRAEVGYWLAEQYWRKGFASEALAAILHFGFDQLGLQKICAHYFSINVASGRVMQKCGMKKEGELKAHIFKKGAFYDLVIYGLVKEDFSAIS